jgi:predicted methyltransferase
MFEMRNTNWLLALSASMALVGGMAAAQPAYVKAAVADPGRPASDTAQDAERHVTEVVVFSGVKPGSKVVDLMPGGGYYTRIWSKIVGPKGKVWAADGNMGNAAVKAIAADPAYSTNVEIVATPLKSLKTSQPADIVFTSRNYHDLHNRGGDPAPVNEAVFKLLKKGGLYVVLDHRALPGVISEPMHRMDPEVAKKEIEAAGFKFVKESQVLARTDDPKNIPVFDPKVRGKTDNFLLMFRKP